MRRSAWTIVLVLANLLVAGALLWSTTERLHVTIVVAAGQVSGRVGPATVQAPAPPRTDGQVGLFLQGADSRATIVWGDLPMPNPLDRQLTGITYRLGAESAWTNVRVTALSPIPAVQTTEIADAGAEHRRLFGDWFLHPLGGLSTATPGLITATATSGSDFQLDADLLRPRNAAGIFVEGADQNNGVLFYFRPENRDVMWYEVRGGQWFGPLATAQYRQFAKDPASSVQDVTRLVLGGYPVAVGVTAIALLFGWIEARLRRRTLAARPGSETTPTDWDGSRTLGLAKEQTGGLAGITAVALVALGLGVSLFVATTLLERMPHVQDSVAYLFQARTFALGRLWVPLPPHPDFFKHEFIVMDGAGRWFSKYPPGWPLLLALGAVAGVPWIVSPLCAAISLFFLYRIGSEIYRPRVGLLAAALCLSAPFFIFLSGSMMAHASGLLFTMIMTWAIWRTSRSRHPAASSILAGAAFGVLLLIRPYTALMVALPLALLAIHTIARRPIDGLNRYLPAAVAAVPFVLLFLFYNKAFTGDFVYPPQQLWWAFDKVGFGPDNGPFGYTPVDALNNTSRNLSELLEHAFGWPQFATLALILVPFLTGRSRAWDWVFLGGLIALIAGYAAWWADGIMFGPRFYYEAFGFQVLLTVRGIDVLLDVAQSKLAAGGLLAHRASLIASASVYAIAGLLVGFNVAYYLPGQLQLYHGYNYVNHGKLDAIQAKGIHNAVVFADVGLPYEWWEYGMVFSANDPLLEGDVVYARDLGDTQDRVLALDFPGRAFWRLNGTTVTPLDLSGTVRGQARSSP